MRTYSYEFRTLLQARRMRLLEQAPPGPELNDVDAALARLADGSFGACLGCGDDIERSQLKADPTARLCPACGVRHGGN